MNHLKSIADVLHGKGHVVLWGACTSAIVPINALYRDYGVRPDAIVDSDANKHGKSFLGLPVMSFEDAAGLYPDMHIFIGWTIYRFQIIGNLIANLRFPKERIINYEPIAKRRSCKLLESMLLCTKGAFSFCCSDFGKKRSPAVAFDGDYETSLQQWEELRDATVAKLGAGERTSCDGCCCVEEDWYAEHRKIILLNYASGGCCNFNCLYCAASAKNSAGITARDIELAKVHGILNDREMLADGLCIALAPGEPTLHRKRDEMYDIFDGKHNFAGVFTNASVYDEKLERCLKDCKCTLLVSVDAGTRETFAKIKGLDVYGRVCGNLKRYAKAAAYAVTLKYIFLPDLNDNEADIDGFVALCGEIRPLNVMLSYDMLHPIQKLAAHTFRMVRRLTDKLDAVGIVWMNISDVIARAYKGDLL
jgi:wyosine [tRNA(Phe)-imidazoG37] synthetase (radical SAM superfamily)